MDVRRVQEADHPAIADLLHQLGYPTEASEVTTRLARVVDRRDYGSWCATDRSGVVVGFALGHLVWPIEQNDAVAQLAALIVDVSSRGLGVGRDLLAAFDGWAQDNGAGRAVVTSGLTRADAHRFYERLGFARTGLRFGRSYSASGQVRRR